MTQWCGRYVPRLHRLGACFTALFHHQLIAMDRLSSLFKDLNVKPGKPKVLEARDIPAIAKYIKSDQCKNIMLMVTVLASFPICGSF